MIDLEEGRVGGEGEPEAVVEGGGPLEAVLPRVHQHQGYKQGEQRPRGSGVFLSTKKDG